MTIFSPQKRIAAMILSTALIFFFIEHNIPINIFVFGERTTLFRLYTPSDKENAQVGLLRLITAIKTGNRYGSYPLDAAIAMLKSFTKKHNQLRTDPNSAHHLSIIITDCISPQNLDKERNWSSEKIKNVLIIGFKNDFNFRKMDELEIPRHVYEKGLSPTIKGKNNIEFLEIHTSDFLFELKEGNQLSCLAQIVISCIHLLGKIPTSIKTSPLSITLCPLKPIHDDSFFWEKYSDFTVFDMCSKTEIFAQQKSSNVILLSSLDISSPFYQNENSEIIEQDNKWLEPHTASSTLTLYWGSANSIDLTSFTHFLVPNRAGGKQ
jgi:hypothetical protein